MCRSNSKIKAIDEVGVDETKRLYVKPVLTSQDGYSFIYRACASVCWNSDKHCLFVKDFPDSTCGLVDDWIRIKSAVEREYGDVLSLTSKTMMKDLPSEFRLYLLETEKPVPLHTDSILGKILSLLRLNTLS